MQTYLKYIEITIRFIIWLTLVYFVFHYYDAKVGLSVCLAQGGCGFATLFEFIIMAVQGYAVIIIVVLVASVSLCYGIAWIVARGAIFIINKTSNASHETDNQ